MVTLRLKGVWLLLLVVAVLGGIRKSATCIWFATSLAFGLLAVAKRGADMMYFFDTSAALAVLTAGVVTSLPQLRRPLLAGVALALGILAVSWNDLNWLSSSAGDGDYRSMIAWLASYPNGKGQVLSDDASIPLALGQNPVWDDPFVFAEWAQLGRWSDEAVVTGVRTGRYAVVVVGFRYLFWSPALLDEIANRYALVKVFRSTTPGPKCIYIPKAAAAAGTRLEPLILSPADMQGLPCYLATQ